MSVAVKDFTVSASDGIHLRPAQLLVEKAQEFPKAEVKLVKDDMEADGKSILSVLALGLDSGQQFRIEVKGPQAEACLAAIETVIHKEKIA